MKNTVFLFPIISGICFGSVGVFVRRLYNAGFNNYAVLAVRTSAAALLLFVFLFFYNKNLLKIKIKDIPFLAGSGLFGMTLTNICFNVSVNNLSLALTGVLLNLSPVFVVLFSRILFNEKFTRKKIICIPLAFFGAFLVSNIIENGFGHLSVIGILSGILAGISLAMTSVFGKLLTGRGYDGITITFYAILTTAIFTAPFSNWDAVLSFASDSPFSNIVLLVLHSILCAALPYLLYNISLKYLEAGTVSILASDEPVAALIFGLIVFGEPITLFSAAGMLLTLLAIVIMTSGK